MHQSKQWVGDGGGKKYQSQQLIQCSGVKGLNRQMKRKERCIWNRYVCKQELVCDFKMYIKLGKESMDHSIFWKQLIFWKILT